MDKEIKIELIVVFKKEMDKGKAESILNHTKIKYRAGMDSSRGKIYFYKTGPKFILTFADEEQRSEFISGFKKNKAVYELYEPDWRIQKD